LEVLPGIHRIPRIKGPNAYLLEGEDLTLIDTGWPGNAPTILSYIRALGWQTDQLARILITHGHPDHTGSARFLREETGARVLAHAADTQRDRTGVPVVRHVGMLFMPLPSVWRVSVDMALVDGDSLPVMGGLRVVHAPGHTPGSICFYLEDSNTPFHWRPHQPARPLCLAAGLYTWNGLQGFERIAAACGRHATRPRMPLPWEPGTARGLENNQERRPLAFGIA
jgi:glyoxylase-like metal-dependent hydrolase (beta-lactamase superfamily II)